MNVAINDCHNKPCVVNWIIDQDGTEPPRHAKKKKGGGGGGGGGKKDLSSGHIQIVHEMLILESLHLNPIFYMTLSVCLKKYALF